MLNDTARRHLLPSAAITETIHIRSCQDRVVTVGIGLRRRHHSNSSSSSSGVTVDREPEALSLDYQALLE